MLRQKHKECPKLKESENYPRKDEMGYGLISEQCLSQKSLQQKSDFP